MSSSAWPSNWNRCRRSEGCGRIAAGQMIDVRSSDEDVARGVAREVGITRADDVLDAAHMARHATAYARCRTRREV